MACNAVCFSRRQIDNQDRERHSRVHKALGKVKPLGQTETDQPGFAGGAEDKVRRSHGLRRERVRARARQEGVGTRRGRGEHVRCRHVRTRSRGCRQAHRRNYSSGGRHCYDSGEQSFARGGFRVQMATIAPSPHLPSIFSALADSFELRLLPRASSLLSRRARVARFTRRLQASQWGTPSSEPGLRSQWSSARGCWETSSTVFRDL